MQLQAGEKLFLISFETYINHFFILFYVLKSLYESERSFPQHCILNSNTLHSRSLPLNKFRNATILFIKI